VAVTIGAPELPDDDSSTSSHVQNIAADASVSSNVFTVTSENSTMVDTEVITYVDTVGTSTWTNYTIKAVYDDTTYTTTTTTTNDVGGATVSTATQKITYDDTSSLWMEVDSATMAGKTTTVTTTYNDTYIMEHTTMAAGVVVDLYSVTNITFATTSDATAGTTTVTATYNEATVAAPTAWSLV
jgi:hypothetical protein